MKNSDFENITSQIESNVSFVKYDYEISTLFEKAVEENEKELTDNQKNQLVWNILLFRLMTKNHFNSDGLKTERFKPMVTYTNGEVFPNPNNFAPEALAYFENRVSKVTSPIIKARYLDFLWEKSKSKQKHEFAREAIAQYLLTIDTYQNEDAIFERLDGLQRAIELCFYLGINKKGDQLYGKVIAILVREIQKTYESKKYRWLIDLFEMVCECKEAFSLKEIQQYFEYCIEASSFYEKENNFHLQRAIIELKIKFSIIIKQSIDDIKVIKEEIAESYVKEAEAKSESGIVKVHFLEEAIKSYTSLGKTEKVPFLISEIKKATNNAVKNHEFKKISTTINLKKEDIEKMKLCLGVHSDVPGTMGTSPSFFPNWENAKRTTTKLAKNIFFNTWAVLFTTVKSIRYGKQKPLNRNKRITL
jgi:hypothetical protein